MLDIFLKVFELLGGVLGAIFLVALAAGTAAAWYVGAAVREPGPDREQLVRWLEQGALRAQYVWLLERALDRLDRFLGDAGRADLSWPSPFGNRRPAPCRTGRALDACALLAVVYPLASVLFVWAWVGDAGPLGEILRLETGEAVQNRMIVIGLPLLVFATAYRLSNRGPRRAVGWLTASAALLLSVGLSLVYDSAATVGLVLVTLVNVVVVALSGAVVVAGAASSGFVSTGAPGLALAFVLASTVSWLAACARSWDRLGLFWAAFGPLALLLAYGGLAATAAENGPYVLLILIVTFAILPLVNLPFDFASLGLTRALLRRGCEPDAPSPFLLGLLDLALALLLLTGLAFAMVLAAQAADAIAWRLSGATFLNLPYVLDLIAEQPADPAHWWIYFLLFSTLTPSVLNAMIGAFSLLSWSMTRLREWLLGTLRMVEARPEGWTGLGATRIRIVSAFAVQAGISAALPFGALWVLFKLLTVAVPDALPALLDALRWFAALTGGWFGLPRFG